MFYNTPSFSQTHMKCSMRKTVLLLFQASLCSWWGHNAGVYASTPREFKVQKDSTPFFLQLYRQIYSTGVFVVFVGSHLQQILPEMWASFRLTV